MRMRFDLVWMTNLFRGRLKMTEKIACLILPKKIWICSLENFCKNLDWRYVYQTGLNYSIDSLVRCCCNLKVSNGVITATTITAGSASESLYTPKSYSNPTGRFNFKHLVMIFQFIIHILLEVWTIIWMEVAINIILNSNVHLILRSKKNIVYRVLCRSYLLTCILHYILHLDPSVVSENMASNEVAVIFPYWIQSSTSTVRNK